MADGECKVVEGALHSEVKTPSEEGERFQHETHSPASSLSDHSNDIHIMA